jgi:hypothetical protein
MADHCLPVEGEPVTQVTQIRGHGQQFSFGAYTRIFRVDPSKLPGREEASDTAENDLLKIYKATCPLPIDYRNTPFSTPICELDMDAFICHEGWLKHIEDYTPAELTDACRPPTEEDGDLHELKDAVVEYIERVQPEILKGAACGLQKLMVDVGLYVQVFCPRRRSLTNHSRISDSFAGFNTMEPESCERYGRLLWRLVFNLLRQLKGTAGAYVYPLTQVQTDSLTALAVSVDSPPNVVETLVHGAVNTLFSQIKTHNKADKYFAAVSCFAVLTMGELHFTGLDWVRQAAEVHTKCC